MHLKRQIVGKRIIKTGLAVFLTAWICMIFDLPALFAVITAIVTIEPTAADSIKKGTIRFPASVIGAGFAMIFEFFFAQAPITFALSATFTIWACQALRLDAGILVAALTAVAMIPETDGHYFMSFVIRLGTTLIGISVSALVNYFILPPKFYPLIVENLNELYRQAGGFLEEIIENEANAIKQWSRKYQKMTKKLERTFQLMNFQRAEWKYHRYAVGDIRRMNVIQKKLDYLQKILYHFGNLNGLQLKNIKPEDREVIKQAGTSISNILRDPNHDIPNIHYETIDRLDNLFRGLKEQPNSEENKHYRHHFSQETVMIYELLSLHDVLEELEEVCAKNNEQNR